MCLDKTVPGVVVLLRLLLRVERTKHLYIWTQTLKLLLDAIRTIDESWNPWRVNANDHHASGILGKVLNGLIGEHCSGSNVVVSNICCDASRRWCRHIHRDDRNPLADRLGLWTHKEIWCQGHHTNTVTCGPGQILEEPDCGLIVNVWWCHD